MSASRSLSDLPEIFRLIGNLLVIMESSVASEAFLVAISHAEVVSSASAERDQLRESEVGVLPFLCLLFFLFPFHRKREEERKE